MDWTTILIALSLIAILGYQLFNKITSAKTMVVLLANFYDDKELRIIKISKLSIPEKMKYGVPLSPFIGFLTTTLGVVSNLNNGYYRKIVTVDKSDNEQIRFIGFDLNNSSISVDEIDIYEF